jgi:hypothetical protein
MDEKTTARREMKAHVLAAIPDQKDDLPLVSLMSALA